MLTAKLEAKAAQAALNTLLLQIKDGSKLFKTWGTVVRNKAQSNARGKGGRRLWKRIADSVVLAAVSNHGARVLCMDYIGAHKETGGPIIAKRREYLTIPLTEESRGKTAPEMRLDGVRLFRIGKTLGRKEGKDGFVALFALCKKTRSQRAEKWWPDPKWVLEAGMKEAKWHIEKGH